MIISHIQQKTDIMMKERWRKFMIRLIACDLDETLLDVNKNIPKANLEAIQKAKAQGIYFVCAMLF